MDFLRCVSSFARIAQYLHLCAMNPPKANESQRFRKHFAIKHCLCLSIWRRTFTINWLKPEKCLQVLLVMWFVFTSLVLVGLAVLCCCCWLRWNSNVVQEEIWDKRTLYVKWLAHSINDDYARNQPSSHQLIQFNILSFFIAETINLFMMAPQITSHATPFKSIADYFFFRQRTNVYCWKLWNWITTVWFAQNKHIIRTL